MPVPVWVLLPVHNRRDITTQCVQQLLAQSYRPIRLIVIDDGSTDSTADMVRKLAPAATVLQGNGKLWWAGCLQRGLDWLVSEGAAREDIVLMLNDDTTFDRRFVENGVEAVKKSPASMLMAQAYSLQSRQFIEAGVRADWPNLRFEPVVDVSNANCLSTRGLFIRFGDAVAVGGFRPRLLPHYLSDYEFTIRALRRGIAAVTDPSVKLFLNEITTGQRVPDKSSLTGYLRSVITKRSTSNPFYWSSFVLLACPARYIALNLYRVWRGFLRELRQAARARQAAS